MEYYLHMGNYCLKPKSDGSGRVEYVNCDQGGTMQDALWVDSGGSPKHISSGKYMDTDDCGADKDVFMRSSVKRGIKWNNKKLCCATNTGNCVSPKDGYNFGLA